MATTPFALPTPLAIQVLSGDTPVAYGGQDLRLLLGAICNRAGRLGLPDSVTLIPNPAGANWSVSIMPGQAVMFPTMWPAVPANGYNPERYLVTVPYATGTTPINISLTGFNTAPVTTRTHSVFMVIKDASQTGVGVGYGASLIVTEDVGSGAPDPTGVSFSHRIGTVTIAPGQSNITAAHLATTMQRASRATPITAVTYLSGFITTASSVAGATGMGQALSYSVDGNTVRFQGSVSRTAGAAFTPGTDYNVATLPVDVRPKFTRFMSNATAGPDSFRVKVFTTGEVEISPMDTDFLFAPLDGVTFEIY